MVGNSGMTYADIVTATRTNDIPSFRDIQRTVKSHIHNSRSLTTKIETIRSKKKNVRCGGILLNPSLSKVVIILNRYSEQTGNPKWGLPKGHRDHEDESFQECATREIYEETGIRTCINANTPRIKINDTYYFVMIINENTRFNPHDKGEISKVKWMDIDQIDSLPCNRGLKKFSKMKKKMHYLLYRNHENCTGTTLDGNTPTFNSIFCAA